MTKTKIQKIVAVLAMIVLGFTNASATQIGTGSVSGTGAFDSAINWDDNFPGTASGSVSNIVIKARVNPVLNMTISDAEIDLGVLAAGVASNGSLDIEIGTNAVSGVSITARSGSGGLTNVADNSVQINNLTTDEIQENYTWTSNINGTDDSSYASFSATNVSGGTGLDSAREITENSTQYTVYSTNKPEATSAVDDVEFVVSATSVIETPAGDYEDTVTFTVTGNF